MAKSKSWNNTS